jgi:oligopeptide/dipeptide ABC transporter ATP-binding protein
VFDSARHPYSRALVASTLVPDPKRRYEQGQRRERLRGEIPSPIDLPKGCYLASRCAYVQERCKTEPQALLSVEEGHQARCWRVIERDLVFDQPVVATAR